MGNELTVLQRKFILDEVLGTEPLKEGPATSTAIVQSLTAMRDVLLGGDNFAWCVENMLPLLHNNHETRNVNSVLSVAWTAVDHAVCTRDAGYGHTCAALRAAQNLVRLSTMNCNGDATMLLSSLDYDAGSTKLVNALVEYTVQVPFESATARTHCEVLLLLLSYFSTAVHHDPNPDPVRKDVYLETVLSHDLIEALCQTLLIRVALWGNEGLPGGSYVYTEGYQPTLFNAYHLFGTIRRDKRVGVAELSGRLSLHVLMALVMYQKGSKEANPAMIALRNWQDGEHISFDMLLAAIKSLIRSQPAAMVLLYALMEDHRSFFSTVMSKNMSAFKEIVEGLLFHLSETETGRFAQLAATLLLMLSQDATLNAALFTWPVSVDWFTARPGVSKYLGTCSLGSLAVVCLSKTITRNVLVTRNFVLGTVAVGIIANIGPFISGIEAYPAQRYVAALSNVVKRAHLLHTQIAATPDAYSLISEAHVVNDAAQTLAEVLYVAVSGHSRENHSLTYELLYKSGFNAEKQSGDGSGFPSKVSDALAPLQHLTAFYESELASVSDGHTAQDIMAIIKRVGVDTSVIDVVAGDSSSVFRRDYEDLIFEYREGDDSNAFFTMLLWESATQDAALGLRHDVLGECGLFRYARSLEESKHDTSSLGSSFGHGRSNASSVRSA